MKLSHRLQEWLADRVSWIQYPNLTITDKPTPKIEKKANWLLAGWLFIFSSWLMLIGLTLLGFSLFVLWCIVDYAFFS